MPNYGNNDVSNVTNCQTCYSSNIENKQFMSSGKYFVSPRVRMSLLGGQPIQVMGEQGKFFTVLTLSSSGPPRVNMGPLRANFEDTEDSEEDILMCGRCKSHFSQVGTCAGQVWRIWTHRIRTPELVSLVLAARRDSVN